MILWQGTLLCVALAVFTWSSASSWAELGWRDQDGIAHRCGSQENLEGWTHLSGAFSFCVDTRPLSYV